ncbi:high-affinity zinc uptake system protein ZnuA-like [Diorhabda carinulata]|uniref:high-affinity zinc uptake system protein ZnuA-like n=1 Tax=Diorhabda carinulata TaxID=1163345 RepID=UPI0025A1F3C5|nr:high-affinity zinc uptake system protein ZnuA-like [Diorhabda carinulata]
MRYPKRLNIFEQLDVHVIFECVQVEPMTKNSSISRVHIKIHVPHIIHKHNDKHRVIVHKKPHVVEGGKKHVVIHKHNHEHSHRYDHKQHKPDHYDEKHHHKGTHDKPFSAHKTPIIKDNSLNSQVEKLDDRKVQNTQKSSNHNQLKSSLKTEHIEITEINPLATKPGDKINIRGSYRVQESDPYDVTTSSYHEYDSPFTKEIAKTLTNYKEYFEEPYENYKLDEDKEDNDIQLDNYRNYGEERSKQVILYKSNDKKSTSSY